MLPLQCQHRQKPDNMFYRLLSVQIYGKRTKVSRSTKMSHGNKVRVASFLWGCLRSLSEVYANRHGALVFPSGRYGTFDSNTVYRFTFTFNILYYTKYLLFTYFAFTFTFNIHGHMNGYNIYNLCTISIFTFTFRPSHLAK